MKKLLTLSYAYATLSLLISSCSSNMSIVKRRYTKGYYVEHFSKHPINSVTPKTAEIKVNKTLQTIQAKPVLIEEPGKAEQETRSLVSIAKSTSIQTTPISEPNQYQLAGQTIQTFQNSSHLTILENKEILSQAYDDGDAAAGAALSLLWIVIVVILIVWLIGILAGGFGLGGLINLLLIIALILLILWLLRIW